MSELAEIMQAAFSDYIGPGSSMHNQRFMKDGLPEILTKYKIKSVNDAGCGLGWVGDLLIGIDYTGFDIVNRSDSTCLDITSEVMPKADLIICRDVLFHLSNCDARKALENFKASNSKYLLATSSDDAINKDRPRNYCGAVINSIINLVDFLGEPIEKIEEEGLQRYMGLWKL